MKGTPPSRMMAMLPLLVFLGCRSMPTVDSLQRYEFTGPHMGTLFGITLYAADKSSAEQAAKAAFARVAELNRVMSDYVPESELMQLCRKPPGAPVLASDGLFDILTRSQAFSRMSNGAFDVTVGPYVRLWRAARNKKVLPSPEEMAAVAGAVGYKNIRLDPRAQTVTLLAPNMQLDLGGIAKGYAADQALEVLRRRGLNRAIVAAGGDIAIGDPPPDRKGWGIGIASVDSSENGLTKTVLLRNAAVSTSGDTEQFVKIGGVRYSHIVDPATGRGLTERIGVTIIARNATTTDALATAISVMGMERGLKLIESLPGVSGLIVTLDKDGKHVIESRRFKQIRKAQLPADIQHPNPK